MSEDEVTMSRMKGYRENSCTSKQSPVGIAPHLSNKVLVITILMMRIMFMIMMIMDEIAPVGPLCEACCTSGGAEQ